MLLIVATSFNLPPFCIASGQNTQDSISYKFMLPCHNQLLKIVIVFYLKYHAFVWTVCSWHQMQRHLISKIFLICLIYTDFVLIEGTIVGYNRNQAHFGKVNIEIIIINYLVTNTDLFWAETFKTAFNNSVMVLSPANR